MKKVVLLACVALLGFTSCHKTVCPAYSSTKAAAHTSTPITASTATPANQQ